ncbi:MAG: hypothetical protein WC718_05660 [Phycisphaerales bacterium]|jgi:hypothetical protein
MGASFGFLRWRDQRESTHTVLWLARFSLLISDIEAALLWGVPQAREAILVMAEDVDLPLLSVFGLCLAALCSLSWYSVRVLLYMRVPDSDTWPGFPGWSARNIPRICGILPALAVAIAVLGTLRDSNIASGVRGVLWRLFALAIIGAVIGYIILWARRRVLKIVHEPKVEPRRPWELSPGTRRIALASIISSALLFLLFTFNAGAARHIGPLSVLIAAGALWIPFGAMLVYFSDVVRLPLVTLFFAIAMLWQALNLNDNHTVRSIPSGAPSVQAAVMQPKDLGTHFREWLAARPDLAAYTDAHKPYPVILVSAEGGGIYAAYTSAIALSRLQDLDPRFATHLFATSGVSGGSVGTSVFGAMAVHGFPRSAPSPGSPETQGPCEAMASKVLEHDLLSPLLAGALFPDLVQQFIPFPIGAFDRATPLEQGLEAAFDGAGGKGEMTHPIDTLLGSPASNIPAMYFNTTCVETGGLAYVGPYPILANGAYPDADLADAWRPTSSVRLSTAAVLSARFPLVTPAGKVNTGFDQNMRPLVHRFVDGGYFDNPGTATLETIIAAIRQAHASDDPPIQLVVLRIGFSDLPGPTSYGFGEIMSPLRAILATRGQHAQATRRRLDYDAGLDIHDLTIALDTRGQGSGGGRALPLGWMLSSAARQDIRTQVAWPDTSGPLNAQAMNSILNWLKTP